MKVNKLLAISIATLGILSFTGCSASFQRSMTDMKSNWNGGLNRTINVYTYSGDLIATYTGKIDIDDTTEGYVKFDFDGKRYIYYNCTIETIADI